MRRVRTRRVIISMIASPPPVGTKRRNQKTKNRRILETTTMRPKTNLRAPRAAESIQSPVAREAVVMAVGLRRVLLIRMAILWST